MLYCANNYFRNLFLQVLHLFNILNHSSLWLFWLAIKIKKIINVLNIFNYIWFKKNLPILFFYLILFQLLLFSIFCYAGSYLVSFSDLCFAFFTTLSRFTVLHCLLVWTLFLLSSPASQVIIRYKKAWKNCIERENSITW